MNWMYGPCNVCRFPLSSLQLRLTSQSIALPAEELEEYAGVVDRVKASLDEGKELDLSGTPPCRLFGASCVVP